MFWCFYIVVVVLCAMIIGAALYIKMTERAEIFAFRAKIKHEKMVHRMIP
jgi:hypothetical protein